MFFSEWLLALTKFVANIFNSYGVSVIVVTLILKLLLAPFNIRQHKISWIMKSVDKKVKDITLQKSAKSREEIVRIQIDVENEVLSKYGMKKSGTCLFSFINLVITILFLFSFYMIISKNKDIADEKFLWFELGEVDATFILPILTGIAYMTYFVINSKYTTNRKVALYLGASITLLVVFMGLQVPAVLYVYWLVSNVLTITILIYSEYRYKFILKGGEV